MKTITLTTEEQEWIVVALKERVRNINYPVQSPKGSAGYEWTQDLKALIEKVE